MTGGPTDVVASSTGAVSTTATTMYLYAGEKVNGVQYYYINDVATVTPTTAASRHFLGDDGGMVRSRGARVGTRTEWYLQEAVATATTPTVSYATSITSGSYYRLVNASHSGQYMTDMGGSVNIAGSNGKYSQIWQITGSNGSTNSRTCSQESLFRLGPARVPSGRRATPLPISILARLLRAKTRYSGLPSRTTHLKTSRSTQLPTRATLWSLGRQVQTLRSGCSSL